MRVRFKIIKLIWNLKRGRVRVRRWGETEQRRGRGVLLATSASVEKTLLGSQHTKLQVHGGRCLSLDVSSFHGSAAL